jgi:hypothetical protein
MNNKIKFIFLGISILSSFVLSTNGASASNCGGAYPQAGSTTATSGSFRVYAVGVNGASYMYFPTWSDAGGQDDIVWYPVFMMVVETGMLILILAVTRVMAQSMSMFI